MCCIVLAPRLFGTFFAALFKHSFGSASEGIYLHTRSDRNLLKLSRLRAMTKVQTKRLGKSLFADDAAVTTHSEEDLQQLMNRFADACKDFWACHQPQKDAGDGAPTIHRHRRLPSWKPSTSLCTWVRQYRTASPLRPRSAGASGTLPLHSLGRLKEFGQTVNSLSTLKSRSTRPAY